MRLVIVAAKVYTEKGKVCVLPVEIRLCKDGDTRKHERWALRRAKKAGYDVASCEVYDADKASGNFGFLRCLEGSYYDD